MKAQTYNDFADSLQSWVEARIDSAKNDVKEIVELPYVIRSTGWGCECPYYYIGVSTTTMDGVYVSPIAPRQMPFAPSSAGYNYIVTGYFTGKVKTKKYGEEKYDLPEFRILTFEKNNLGYDSPPPRIIETK